MPRAGQPGTLVSRFNETDSAKMAAELERVVAEYQKTYGKRPGFVYIHESLGGSLERYLQYNFFDKDHQIVTKHHRDQDKSRIYATDKEDASLLP